MTPEHRCRYSIQVEIKDVLHVQFLKCLCLCTGRISCHITEAFMHSLVKLRQARWESLQCNDHWRQSVQEVLSSLKFQTGSFIAICRWIFLAILNQNILNVCTAESLWLKKSTFKTHLIQQSKSNSLKLWNYANNRVIFELISPKTLVSKVLQGHQPFPATTDRRFIYHPAFISVIIPHVLIQTPQAPMVKMS